MTANFQITGLNQDIEWKNQKANFDWIEQKAIDLKTDLLLLPEMFSTGFCMDAEEIADDEEKTLAWMKSLAAKHQFAVAGSVSVKVAHLFYNRFYFVKPDGNFEFYDKRHLFSYSGEDRIYHPGKFRKVVEYKGIRFLLQVCYDLRFPVFSRNNDDYDVALYVANWPKSRVEAWKHLLKARAIENQAYIFGLNRLGIDGNNLEYEESSRCFFADGSEISAHEEQLVYADIDISQLQQFRSKFPFLKDRDGFEINF